MCRRSPGECTLLACLMGAVALVPSLARAGGSPQEVRSAAVRDLVHEALHREIYGLAGDRQRLLEEASQLDPQYKPAKWHQGSASACWTADGRRRR